MLKRDNLVYRVVLSVLVVVIVGLNVGCDKGRLNVFSLQDDKDLGQRVAKEIASDPQKYPILSESQYAKVYQKMYAIRDELLNSGKFDHAKDFDWELKVIDQPVLNAFCAPGGYIFFYTGLLNYLDNEAEVAGVLGHEMAHADRRHTTHQLTKAKGLDFMLSLVTGITNSKIAEVAAQLAGSAAKLKFSRDDESEADAFAVTYLSETRYDPLGVAGFFEKLLQGDSKSQPIEFLSTHPNHEHRVKDIHKKWEKLGSKKGERYEAEYASFKMLLPH